MPTTNMCPYLPGQTVNTLEVPLEHNLLRERSASMNSLRGTDFQTMDPEDRFMTPRPAPPVPSLPDLRVGSSPAMSLVHKRSTRSLSPAPHWTGAARRFLGIKKSFNRDSDTGSETEVESNYTRQSRRITPSGSIRSRDMSPEALEKFLSDDWLTSPAPFGPAPRLFIPEELVEEVDDDEENFATSAVSENAPYTMLSPPPFQRSTSASTVRGNENPSTATIVPMEFPLEKTTTFGSINGQDNTDSVEVALPRSHFSFSTTSSSLASPASPASTGSRDPGQFSFFDETDEDEEEIFSNGDEPFILRGSYRDNRNRSIPKNIHTPITGYSLPQPTSHNKHAEVSHLPATLGSPELVARLDSGVPLGSASLLSRPSIDTGFDDLVNDMGWMADVIQPKYI